MSNPHSQLSALSEDEELRASIAEIVNRRLDRTAAPGGLESAPRGNAEFGLEGGLEGLRPRRGAAPRGNGLELNAQSAASSERAAVDNGDFGHVANGGLEAIVLLAGRPVFFVRQDRVVIPNDADISGLMLNRVNAALPRVEPWLPSIGRLDVLNALNFAHIGTAWMVQGNIAVTNRHVAEAFVSHGGRGIQLLQNEDGQDYETGIDFVREDGFKGKPAPLRIRRVLHVEPSGGPDIALVEVVSEQPLPKPIELDTGKLADKHNVMNIGYPAYDDRNDEIEMQRIFGGVYGVKRCAPGQTRASKDKSPFTLEHDATTLGGCSGSVLLSMETGRAVGLHFSGAYKRTNVAVRAGAVLDALARLKPSVPVSPKHAADPPDDEAARPRGPDAQTLQRRKGYDAKFLRQSLPLPQLTDKIGNDLLRTNDLPDGELRYHRYSVKMSRSRKMALFTACNIDGNALHAVKRTADKWLLDPRLSVEDQAGEALYARNKLQRGHLVRRLDPAWGTRDQAVAAIADTFYFTNCTPQHEQFNPKTWLGLEDYVLNTADAEDIKISVFTGPVLRSRDPDYRDFKIPQEYWKVVAFCENNRGSLRAAAYLLSQSAHLDDLEFAFGPYKTYQTSVAEIQKRTGLDFGALREADVFGNESVAAYRLLEAPDEMVL